METLLNYDSRREPFLEFSIAAASGLDETQSVKNVHKVSGKRFA